MELQQFGSFATLCLIQTKLIRATLTFIQSKAKVIIWCRHDYEILVLESPCQKFKLFIGLIEFFYLYTNSL